jgi:anti-sigma factor RsiW
MKKAMNCVSPPALEDRQLLAYLDSEAGPGVAAHLEACAYCRARAGELASLQAGLTARLYRLTCPSPEELGDYYLGMLPVRRAATVADHLQECPHCSSESAQLQDYLVEFGPSLKTGLVDQVKVLVARLVGEKRESRQFGDVSFAPAFAMLRGDAQGPITLEADGVLILLDVQPGADGRATILGQVAAEEQERWTGAAVELRQGGALQGTTSIDDLGTFRYEGVLPGKAELQILPTGGPIVLANIEVIV